MLLDSQLIGIISEKDKDSRITKCNDVFLEYAGLKSDNTILGLTDYDLPWAKHADIYRRHELDTIEGNNHSIIYPLIDSSGKKRLFLHTKIGKQDDHGNITTILCHAIEILNPDINYLFSLLLNCNPEELCIFSVGGVSKNNIKVTNREKEVLFFLSKGRTAKSVARALNISPRTVRCHIEHIKTKLNCHTKEELIDAAMEQGFSQILPTSWSARDLLKKLQVLK